MGEVGPSIARCGMTFDMAPFAALGFVAELFDSALGMGFGVITTALLLGLGLAPASVSASVQVAKAVTGAASGLSHAAFGNVDRLLVIKLTIAGVAGGIIGAFALSGISSDIARPIVAAYLLLAGIMIVLNARRRVIALPMLDHPWSLGLIAGFLNAIGGGWGPLVTSTLIAGGRQPRIAIGSANFAEFVVAIATSATFVLTIGLDHLPIALGLSLGGVLAAPLGAYLARRVSPRPLMIAVAITIIAVSAGTLLDTILGVRPGAAGS
jgi:uncharacterized protein